MQACDPDYVVDKVHRVVAEKLQAVADGKCKRLIITLPPRVGKTRLVSQELPTFMLGRNPKLQVVVSSYAKSLAEDSSRPSRARIESSETYQTIFKTRLAAGNTKIDDWGTEAGGRYLAVGVGGSTTGKGADCLLPETYILTDKGSIKIKDLAEQSASCKVLSYDENLKQLVWKKIKAVTIIQ